MMMNTICRPVYLLLFVWSVCFHSIFAPTAHATDKVHKNRVEPDSELELQNYVSSEVDNVHTFDSKGDSNGFIYISSDCKECGLGSKHQENHQNSHRHRQSRALNHADSSSMPVTAFPEVGTSRSKTRDNGANIQGEHALYKEPQTEKTLLSQSQLNQPQSKLKQPQSQLNQPDDPTIKLSLEEKLKRLLSARRATKKKYVNFNEENSKPISATSEKIMATSKSERGSTMQVQKETVLRKNIWDSLSRLKSETLPGHPVNVHPTRRGENDRLPNIDRVNVNIHRNRGFTWTNNQGDPHQSSVSYSASTGSSQKPNSHHMLLKDPNMFRNNGIQTPKSNNNKSEFPQEISELMKITHGDRTRENHGVELQEESAQGSQKNKSQVVDVVQNRISSKDEWLGDDPWPQAASRSWLGETRPVRPAAADKWEHRNSPNLRSSYHQLMNNIHGIFQKLADSFQKMNGYHAEIFNGTRYDIMMGARDVIEVLHEANTYIYDGVTSSTEFSRRVRMKKLMNQSSRPSGPVPEVARRNFETQKENVLDEQRQAQIEKSGAQMLKMKCREGDNHLHQARKLFHSHFDRPSFRDLYEHLNSTIIQLNIRYPASPKLTQLREKKFLLDHLKSELVKAKSLLTDSAVAVREGLAQIQASHIVYNRWLQRRNTQTLPQESRSNLELARDFRLQQSVTQVKTHVHQLQEQNKNFQRILESPVAAAKLVLEREDSGAVFLQLKSSHRSLKQLILEMFSSLDTLRDFIGGKGKLTYTKACRSTTEGSGWIETDDNDDLLCEENEDGLENSDNEKLFISDDEDFTFVDEPKSSENSPKYTLNLLEGDLKNFTDQLLQKSETYYGLTMNLQQSLSAMKETWNDLDSKISQPVKSARHLKDDILKGMRKFEEIQNKTGKIFARLADVNKFNLSDIMDKARQAIERAKTRIDKKPLPEETVIRNSGEDETDKTSNSNEIDLSGLLIQGKKIMSHLENINLLQSVAMEQCGKFGSHFSRARSNITLLRHKVEAARHMLTSLQLSASKLGSGHISVPIPGSHGDTAESLTTSIRICVKPKSLDGSVLVVKGNNSSASYGVTLEDGEMTVTAYDKETDDIGAVTLDSMSVSEQWYTLEIQRFGETLTILVSSQSGEVQTKSRKVTGLGLLQPHPIMAYIGGVPPSLGMSGEPWEGCVGELTVNGRAMNLFGTTSSEGTGPDLCSDHCFSEKYKLAMIFSGNSFVQFSRSPREIISSVTVHFKTWQKMASLLSVVNKSQHFFLSVVIANGAVKIESSSPVEKVVLLSLNSSLSDGTNHFLRIVYRDGKTYPELDGNRQAFSVEVAAPQIVQEISDGVHIGALLSETGQFLNTTYRPLIGCIHEISVNGEGLHLSDSSQIYNTFSGSCRTSDINTWQSCWQWTERSSHLSLGLLENSNWLSLLVSGDARGPLIHYVKGEDYDLEISITSSGIEVSSDNSEDVIVRPVRDEAYFTLITVTDDGRNVITEAWGQSVKISYGGFWGFATTDLSKPHTVAIGEAREGDRIFVGSVSQFMIQDRLYDLGQHTSTHDIQLCERPLEAVLPETETLLQDPFSCT